MYNKVFFFEGISHSSFYLLIMTITKDLLLLWNHQLDVKWLGIEHTV